MKTIRCSDEENSKEFCGLCKLTDDCPNKYGEMITLKQHNLTAHYFCLLMSSGIYQRGEEHEGIHGFLIEDIKQEIRRSSKLTCGICKKKGASVGCNIKSCRKMFHLPCGIQQEFIFQFTGQFASFCKDHRPTQTLAPPPCLDAPLSCSVCLETLEPVLSYTVLKCPCCHSGWFHRDCLQHQAHSAGLFFFKCTICNNKEKFQQEMLRMGIHIPEKDASWELEENAYVELLQVYQRCDALKCCCHSGRTYSSRRVGKWQVLLCKFCGSRGTHRQCASIGRYENSWMCEDCRPAVTENAILRQRIKSSPSGTRGSKRLLKRGAPSLRSAIVCKRPCPQPSSAGEVLKKLATQISEVRSVQEVVVKKNGVFQAALETLRQSGFDPRHSMAVRFASEKLRRDEVNGGHLRRFLRVLVQQCQNSTLFEGPENAKNLALDSQALREDLYFDVGCMLALSLVHGGPPLGFFSSALYQCLFSYPNNSPLTVEDMGDTLFAAKVKTIRDAQSLEELKEATNSASDYLELAGCTRQINSLSDKEALVEDIVNFHLITRMQLPLKRFCEGLKTLGLFEQIQIFPELFSDLFCTPPEKMSADTMADLFSVQFSENEESKKKEMTTVGFWIRYLHDCEEGRCATSLEDVLIFATSADTVPAMGFNPTPSVSFLHTSVSMVAFPGSRPCLNQITLPVASSYEVFKKHMEYAICQLIMVQTT